MDSNNDAFCDKCGKYDTNHIHNFNQQIPEKDYLATTADYENAPTYYFSCSCGDKGTDTFSFGKPLAVSEGLSFVSNGDGTCYVSDIGECTDNNIVIPFTSPHGDKVTAIGERAFFEWPNIVSITIPDSVTVIDHYAFARCTGLKSITIPNSVTSIGKLAFYTCTSLENTIIPDSVTSIDEYAFYGSYSLTNINYRRTEEQWNAISKADKWDHDTGSFTITYNYIDILMTKRCWNCLLYQRTRRYQDRIRFIDTY